MATLTLSAGKLRLTLSPWIGGAIAAFEWIESEAEALRHIEQLEAGRDAASAG